MAVGVKGEKAEEYEAFELGEAEIDPDPSERAVPD